MKKIYAILLILFIFSILSCDNGTEPEKLSVDILRSGWIYKNISPEWQQMSGWSDTSSTAFFQFDLWYEGEKRTSEELTSYKAEAYGASFTVPIVEDIFLDSTMDPNVHGFDSFYLFRVGSGSHFMPLGPWTFTLNFADGSETVYTETYNRPGTLEIHENSYFITEDYSGTTTDLFFPMIKRAIITDATVLSGNLTIEFIVDDNMVCSGWVWIYSDDGNYIGATIERFVWEDVVSENLNGGNGSFYIDSTPNTYTIDLTEDINNSITNGDYKVVIVLIDGYQYSGETFDGMSYSAPFDFSY